ncbi:MAG: hypothetical protein QXR40_06050 [Candidatus Bathyarchaeia archaeon]
MSLDRAPHAPESSQINGHFLMYSGHKPLEDGVSSTLVLVPVVDL